MIKLQYEEAQAFNIKLNKKAIKLMNPKENLMNSMDFGFQHSEFLLFNARNSIQPFSHLVSNLHRKNKDLNEFFGD